MKTSNMQQVIDNKTKHLSGEAKLIAELYFWIGVTSYQETQ